jgi:hypothetical protein
MFSMIEWGGKKKKIGKNELWSNYISLMPIQRAMLRENSFALFDKNSPEQIL